MITEANAAVIRGGPSSENLAVLEIGMHATTHGGPRPVLSWSGL